MKKIALFFVCIFILQPTFSQTNRDNLRNMIAEEMCLSMDSVPTNPFFKDKFTMQFISIMISIFDKHSSEIKDIFGIEDLQEDSAQILKQQVKNMMLKNCNNLKKLMKINHDDVMKNFSRWQNEPNYITSVYTKLKKIVNDSICYIEFESDNSINIKTYWLENFAGADELIKHPDKFINKWVHISYEQIRRYNYRTHKYEKIKIITEFIPN